MSPAASYPRPRFRPSRWLERELCSTTELCARAVGTTGLSVPASGLAEVLRGEVRDSLAHRDPVAQAGEPGIHGGPADPVDEGPLEVDRADVGRREPDPLGQDLSFCTMNLPPAGVAV